jgi:hypothetical protein
MLVKIGNKRPLKTYFLYFQGGNKKRRISCSFPIRDKVEDMFIQKGLISKYPTNFMTISENGKPETFIHFVWILIFRLTFFDCFDKA